MMQGMSFPPHPAGMQQGVPHGHPGMPPNAQHMGQPMQMPGVSGPGAPHMGQPAMMGMQPGQQNMPPGMGPGPGGGMMPQQSMGGPGANAMAMSHLNPQTHMMQQHHQQMQQAMANNPQLMMQQQQHMARQRQLMAAQQAQQQQAQQQQQQQQMNGMGMGMGMNGHPGMSPQQFAQMQANPAFQQAQMANLPPQHMIQIQQMRQMQAAQAAQAQHAQQQQQQQTPHPQGPQAPATPQMQQQAMAQHMAMQHASSQASHQSAPPNSQPPAQQPPPAQMRSQSQIPSVAEGQGQAQQLSQPPQPQQQQTSQGQPQQQQPQPPQQQQQQQPPQPPSAHPTPQMQAQPLPQQPPSSQPQQPNQQTPQQPGSAQSQNQPQNAQQQQQAQQQAQQAQQQQMQTAQQQQQRQQMMNMNNMNMMRQQQAMAAQQQQQQQQQQPGRSSGGQFILKLIQFSDHLSTFNSRESNSQDQWQAFVNQFWTPDGRLVQHVLDNTNSSTKQFMINASSLARYYWTWFDSGVQNIQLQLEGVREMPAPNNGHWVTCARARYIFWFANNTQLIWQGKLTASFPNAMDKFESLEFEVSKTEEFIPRTELARVVAQGSPLMNKSPKMHRQTPAKKAMQKAQGALQLEDFPSAPVNEYAVTPAVMQYLEVAETIFFMKDLMEYSQKNELRPHDAMNQMVAQMEEQQQFGQPQMNPMQPNHAQMALQRNGIVQPLPQGAGTPIQAHMQLPGQTPNFSSPSVPHMNLPMQHLNGQQMMAMNGSPHVAHPGLPSGSLMAPSHMMGPMHHSPSPHMGPPMMVPQHSQQGNNPNSAHQSASTSPNLSSKRRRSQVKLEGLEEGLEGPPSQRMKPSPGLKKK